MKDNDLYLRGDSEAFAVLMERHMPGVRRYAESKLRDPAGADDVAQEVFIQLARAAGKFKPGHNVVGWIYWLAKCRIKNAQCRRRAVPLADVPCDVSAEAEQNELIAAVQSFKATLRPDHREILTLHMDGVETQEIARRLGVHRNTAGKMLARLRSQAAEALAEHR